MVYIWIRDATSCTLNNPDVVCLLSALELSNNVVQRSELRFKSVQSCEDRLLLNQVESAMRNSILKKVRIQLTYAYACVWCLLDGPEILC